MHHFTDEAPPAYFLTPADSGVENAPGMEDNIENIQSEGTVAKYV